MGDTKDFRLPDLGEGLEEAELVEWYVSVGDTVTLNQSLCQVETAKATVDVPSPFAGTITELVGDVGETLQVGEVFVRIDLGGTPDGAGRSEPEGSETTQPDAEASATTQKRQAVLVGYGAATDGPRRRRRRSGPATASGTTAGRALAKPTVRKLAKDNDVDLATLAPGSGPDGVVTADDVHAAIAARTGADRAPTHAGEAPETVGRSDAEASATTQAGAPVAVGRSDAEASARARSEPEGSATTQHDVIPLKGIRGAIAEKMTLSRTTIPDAACGVTVDCTRLMALRARIRDEHPELTPFALIARYTVAALREHPTMNARIDVDAGEIHLLHHVHLGVAVDTPNGLLVPVVADAHRRSTSDLAAEMRRLAAGARDRTLTPSELMGSTFTISNFGAFGLEDGYPVINHPEAAILGVGAVAQRPWVVDGALAVRHVARLTCVFDHRISDGAEAGRFLTDLAALIEDPERIPVTA